MYNKPIIDLNGKRIGVVKGLVLDMELGSISHLLLKDPKEMPRGEFKKYSIEFSKVKSIGETIIVRSN